MSDSQTTSHEEHHSTGQYVMIAAVLSALTAMEIALYYVESTVNRTLLMIGLYGIAAIKFFLVAAYFMHLKDDPKVFRRWFIVGGVAALILFSVVEVTLHMQDHRFF